MQQVSRGFRGSEWSDHRFKERLEGDSIDTGELQIEQQGNTSWRGQSSTSEINVSEKWIKEP